MLPRVALLVASLLLAGCFGGEAPSVEPQTNGSNESVDPTLPDDRGTAVALQETNKTVEGAGGEHHGHDYWQGRDTVQLYQAEVFFDILPPMPDGEGTQPHSVAYVRFPLHTTVFEGTSTLTVLVAPPELSLLEDLPHPAPAPLTVEYRTAADDATWRAPLSVTYGTALNIPVAPRETDMPHSRSSLWAFRFVSERNEYARLNITISIQRGGDVPEWPGHPDVYADRVERVILDGAGRSSAPEYHEAWLYGNTPEWVHPDLIVAGGTGTLDVYVNITNVEPGAFSEANQFYLIYHNASGLDSDTDYPYVQTAYDAAGHTDAFYHFTIGVHPDGMDSPYQTMSRWGFRLGASVNSGLLTTNGFDGYTVEYTIKVIARKYVPQERPEA